MKGPIALLRGSVDIFMQNPKLFIGIYLIPGILTFVFAFVTQYQDQLGLATPINISIIVALWLVLIVVSILMAVAMILAVMNPMQGIMEAYQAAKPYFWRYLILSILVGLTIFVGFLLLVIPGIIFFVWFAFAYYVLMIEGTSGIDAMKRSKELVKGHWWAVFGRLLVLLLVGLGVGIVVGMLGSFGDMMAGDVLVGILNLIFNAILAPISVAYLYLMYQDLKGVPETAPVETGREAQASETTEESQY